MADLPRSARAVRGLPLNGATTAAKPSSATLPLRRRVGAFGLLMLAELLYGWAWNSVDLLRPQIRAEFDLTLVQAGSFYSAQALGALLGAIVIGQVADRAGRRNTLVAIVAGFGALLAAATVAPTYAALLAQRFVLGLVLGGAQPVIVSLYCGLFPTRVRGRLSSLVNAGFTLSVVGLSAGVAMLQGLDWRLLLWIGAAAALVAAPLMLLVPDDRRYGGYEDDAVVVDPPASKLPVRDLFAPGLRRFTLLLAAMAGLNYFAAQAFTGWTTSFLAEVRGFAPADVGAIVGLQATGSLVGGFFWGWFGDRFGRRRAGIGYLFGGVLMILFLTLVQDPATYRIASFATGFAVAASVVWPPWMAELFPERLRATALSVFNWGRIVSLFAPLATGAVAESQGLATAMLLGPVSLLVVAMLWRLFPETLRRQG